MAPLKQSDSRLFELTSFLEGRTRAWGVFEDRFGRVRRRLAVHMHGHWRDGVFVLDERFEYDGDAVETRTWLVEPLGEGHFRATCPDCVGEATGACSTDSVRMTYRFRLNLESREVVVSFDDRLYRIGDTMAVNRAKMSKWGVKLGELSLFFQRLPDEAESAVRKSA
ncbi:MAG: DUF3833 family protein [Hyphomicrobiaceae bacterium]